MMDKENKLVSDRDENPIWELNVSLAKQNIVLLIKPSNLV
jgi:hypothetical protein